MTHRMPLRFVFIPTALIATLASHCCSQRIGAMAGPFRVIPDHLEDCPPEMQPRVKILKSQHRALRDRKNQDVWYYSGNVTVFKAAGDEFTAAFNLASWSSRGGWKDNAHLLASPQACSKAKVWFPEGWRRLTEQCSSRTAFGECPVKPGHYTCTNVSTNFEFDFPPSFFYGKWRGTGTLYHTLTKEVGFCMRAYFTTAPKASKGPKRKPPQLDLLDKITINK